MFKAFRFTEGQVAKTRRKLSCHRYGKSNYRDDLKKLQRALSEDYFFSHLNLTPLLICWVVKQRLFFFLLLFFQCHRFLEKASLQRNNRVFNAVHAHLLTSGTMETWPCVKRVASRYKSATSCSLKERKMSPLIKGISLWSLYNARQKEAKHHQG